MLYGLRPTVKGPASGIVQKSICTSLRVADQTILQIIPPSLREAHQASTDSLCVAHQTILQIIPPSLREVYQASTD